MEFETYAMGAALFSVTFEVRLTPIDQHLLSVFFSFWDNRQSNLISHRVKAFGLSSSIKMNSIA